MTALHKVLLHLSVASGLFSATPAVAGPQRPQVWVLLRNDARADPKLPACRDAPEDLIAIDEALQALAKKYERKSQVVELRFFGGLSVEETAEALTVSPETVMRDWKFSKAWLKNELRRDETSTNSRR